MLTGKEMKLLRITNDIKANELSEHLNVSKSYVSLIENGKRYMPVDIYEQWISFIDVKNLD